MKEHQALIDELARETAEVLRARRRVPTATYRLQFRGDGFTFRDAIAIVPYLRDLGVSHLYCSPCLAAGKDSPHGYDVVDHSRLNPALGTEDDFRQLVAALREAGMGQIWDIVPNHMGVAGGENAWWQDVLENGPSSPHAACFDIDWHPAKQELRNKVLLPMLGEQYGRVLEEGALTLEFDEGAFWLRCYDSRLPIEPKSYEVPLSLRLAEFKLAQGEDSTGVQRLESIITACHHLPDYVRTEPELVEERQREKEMVKLRLAELVEDDPEIKEFLCENVRLINGNPGDPASFDALDQLLNQQVYRVAHWKAAADEINYRRFFDINELAALCVEEPEVFEQTHDFIFERLVRGDIDGLRIDHVDGLFDPREYLCRLQRGYVARMGRSLFEKRSAAVAGERARSNDSERAAAGAAVETGGGVATVAGEPDVPEWSVLEYEFLHRIAEEHLPELHRVACWPGGRDRHETADDAGARAAVEWPLYVVVEKILEQEEPLAPEWPVAGSTGYDFLNDTARLLVHPGGFREIGKTYRQFARLRREFPEVVYQCKLLILRLAMASELQLLSARLNRLSEKHRRSRDFTLNNLRAALREILASFSVYRTYITDDSVSDRDRRSINEAVLAARRLNPAMDRGLFDFVRRVLLLESPPGLTERDAMARQVFVGRFQQVSSPIMAKGLEDTAFYRYFPLSSLNEVGGTPSPVELGVEGFHRENRLRQRLHPGSLITTTTHDTKRSEDARARIHVLADSGAAGVGPKDWQRAIARWARLNRRHTRKIDNHPAPSRNDQYLFYQTLVAIWPREFPDADMRRDLCERLQQYMAKATHEAKRHTSWVNPDEEYDAAVRDFVAAVLEDDARNRFLPDFTEFHAKLVDCGAYTALSQAFLKLASPGVPDVYQGQELWDFSLVDPDNRRPVDYERREALLAELRFRCDDGPAGRENLVREIARQPHDPRLKLFVTWQMLQFRQHHANLLQNCDYVPLEVTGQRRENVVAFAWRSRVPRPPDEPSSAVVIAPRLLGGLMQPDEEGIPRLPPGPEIWGDTAVVIGEFAPGTMRHILTGQTFDIDRQVELRSVLADFPLTLLVDGPSP